MAPPLRFSLAHRQGDCQARAKAVARAQAEAMGGGKNLRMAVEVPRDPGEVRGITINGAGTYAKAQPLNGPLAALAAAAVLCRGKPGVDAEAFHAQEELIGELADEFTELEAEVRSRRYQDKVPTPMHLPILERIQ
jgi:hypothetical protein